MTSQCTEHDAPASPVTLRLLHDFEMHYEGEAVRVPPSSQRLLCFVALQGRPVRRTQASGSLWLESAEDRANANLRSALWRVPSPGGAPVVGSSHTHLWLRPHVLVDLHAVTERARAVLDGVLDPREAVDLSHDLLRFSDDVLAGWYDDWVIMQRESFRQLRLHALDRLGEQLLDAGRYHEALRVGLAAVASEPLRESAHRLLVRVHLEEGNVAEAIRQYRLYSRLLAEEVHAEPSPAMRCLLPPYAPAPRTGTPRAALLPRAGVRA